jgi:hypothetical protein
MCSHSIIGHLPLASFCFCCVFDGLIAYRKTRDLRTQEEVLFQVAPDAACPSICIIAAASRVLWRF